MDVFKAKNLAVFDKDIPSLKYHFLRKRAGMGLLDPFLTDPHLEDISIVGAGNMYVIHKMFGALKCPVFLSVEEIDDLIVSMGRAIWQDGISCKTSHRRHTSRRL